MSKLVVGCGYLGERVARRWLDDGHKVYVTTRRQERAVMLDRQGFEPVVCDVTRPQTLSTLPSAETVLFAVGFDRTSSAQSIVDVYPGGLKNVLSSISLHSGRVIYISTTGVYGSGDGNWVDENTPLDPQRDGGKASLAAEHVLTNHPLGCNAVILRLAGIYGPGRVPFLSELRSRQPISAPKTGWLNLIHVDDAASAVVAAGKLPPLEERPRLFCVSDGHPVTRPEFYAEVARQIGAPPPRFGEVIADSPRARRGESNRRVSNARMLAELRVKLAYPDYRAGLAQILSS